MVNKTMIAKLIPHLNTFLTKNPQVANTIDQILTRDCDLSGRFSILNEKLRTEVGEEEFADRDLRELNSRISILEGEISALVKNLRDLIRIFQPLSPVECNLKGDFVGNVGKFIEDCEKISEAIAQFDVKNFFTQLKSKFTEFKTLFAQRADNSTHLKREKSDVAALLEENGAFVLLAFAMIKEVCEVSFPDLLAVVKKWR